VLVFCGLTGSESRFSPADVPESACGLAGRGAASPPEFLFADESRAGWDDDAGRPRSRRHSAQQRPPRGSSEPARLSGMLCEYTPPPSTGQQQKPTVLFAWGWLRAPATIENALSHTNRRDHRSPLR
jgi:hypothetical protein